jgi:putative transposase
MPNYRRALIPGGTYFFTAVTHHRRPILLEPRSRKALRTAFLLVKATHPFQVDAVCLLPDHLHCIWTLPENDYDYSTRWKLLKSRFSRQYLSDGGREGEITASRIKKGELAVWQRRFWEHCIRNQEDLDQHVDYIHYNPVKHGLVERVCDWPWSSFHHYVKSGIYGLDWGGDRVMNSLEELKVGE